MTQMCTIYVVLTMTRPVENQSGVFEEGGFTLLSLRQLPKKKEILVS